MSKISGYIGDAVGGAASMFPVIGKAYGAGMVIQATRHLGIKKTRRKSKSSFGFGY